MPKLARFQTSSCNAWAKTRGTDGVRSAVPFAMNVRMLSTRSRAAQTIQFYLSSPSPRAHEKQQEFRSSILIRRRRRLAQSVRICGWQGRSSTQTATWKFFSCTRLKTLWATPSHPRCQTSCLPVAGEVTVPGKLVCSNVQNLQVGSSAHSLHLLLSVVTK